MKTCTITNLILFAMLLTLFPLTALTLRSQNGSLDVMSKRLDIAEAELESVRQRLVKIEDPEHWALLVNTNRKMDPDARDVTRLLKAYNDPRVSDDEIRRLSKELGADR